MKTWKIQVGVLLACAVIAMTYLIATEVRIANAAPANLSGRVTDQGGTGVSGAVVDVLEVGTQNILGNSTTDGTGNYTLAINTGTYDVRVTPPSGSGFQGAIVLGRNITVDTSLDFVLVPVTQFVTLSGYVLDPLGNGVLGQIVRLGTSSFSASVQTDDTGHYSLQAPVATYSLTVSNIGGGSTGPNIPGQYRLQATNFSLTQDTTLDVRLPANRVDVHVQDPNDNPIPSATVTENLDSTQDFIIDGVTFTGYSDYFHRNVVTDDSGNATMWFFPTADTGYTFIVQPPTGSLFVTGTFPDNMVSGDTSLTFTLNQPTFVTLSGYVLDPLGNGVPGQSLRLGTSDFNPGWVGTVSTDDTGHYSLQAPVATYSLTFLGIGGGNTGLNIPGQYRLQATNFSLTQDTTLDIRLPAKRVDVHVQDLNGNPVPNVSVTENLDSIQDFVIDGVTFTGYSDYFHRNVVTDDSGNATMWFFPTADTGYTFIVQPSISGPFVTTLFPDNMVSGDTSLAFSLTPYTFVTLSGYVLDPLGNGVPGQSLRLGTSDFDPGWTTNVQTDDTGHYSLRAPVATYSLMFSGIGGGNTGLNIPGQYWLQTTNFSLTQDTTLDIRLPANRVDIHVQDLNGNPVPNVSVTENLDSPGDFIMDGVTFSGYSDYTHRNVVTDASGNATMWFFPTADTGYTLVIQPPTGSPFIPFHLDGVMVHTDISEVFILQFVHDPPATTASVSPTPNEQGIYPGTVNVSLSASPFPGSVVAATYYQVDNGPTLTYSAPFEIAGNGSHMLAYWSVDDAGVTESARTLSLEIASATSTPTNTPTSTPTNTPTPTSTPTNTPTPTSTLTPTPSPTPISTACNSSIQSNFNGTSIGAGRYIWFNSVLKPSGLGSNPVTIHFSQGLVHFSANGANYTISVPDADITFSSAITSPTTTFDTANNRWITRTPPGLAGNTFLAGVTLPVTSTLPGGINPVTWSGRFTSDTPGVSLNWQWAAAVYTQFSSTYSGLGVKPADAAGGSDHAGTPETYKSYVTGGARGGGGSNYTGGYSGTTSVLPCLSQP